MNTACVTPPSVTGSVDLSETSVAVVNGADIQKISVLSFHFFLSFFKCSEKGIAD